MKVSKTGSIICILITLIFCMADIHALGETAVVPEENIKMENCVINDQYSELNTYEAVYKDFCQAYTSEMFNSGEVVSVNREDVDETETMTTYTYTDGCQLCIADSMMLFYYNRNGDYYSQILTYLNSSKDDCDASDLPGFSLNEAIEAGGRFLSNLAISDLILDKTLTFSKETLIRLTNDMKKAYGEAGAKYFPSITDETEAYYLAYRQTLDGIRSAGTPQVRMIITRNGIAYLEMSRIIDHVAEKHAVNEETSWQDAVRLFEERNAKAYTLPESISAQYEIEEISIAYFSEMNPEQPLCAVVFPCWYIKGYETLSNGEKSRTKQVTDLYRIPDGVWFYPW